MADHFSYQQGSLTVPSQRSPPALSISSRSEQVITLYNSLRLLVTVWILICTYKPCEKVTFSYDLGAHPMLKEGAAQRICLKGSSVDTYSAGLFPA